MAQGSYPRKGRKEVYSVLKEWNTCPTVKKRDVLFPFLEHVKAKLAYNLYLHGIDLEKDLKIAKDISSELDKQYRNFQKKSYEVQLELGRESQRLAKIESFMWKILNSDEDIPKDQKHWMKNKLLGKDEEIIADFCSKSEDMEKVFVLLLEDMEAEVPKKIEPERVKLGQSQRSEAFNTEIYELIEDEKEKYMLLQRKKEEYMMVEQNHQGLTTQLEKLLKPYQSCGTRFHFQQFKGNIKRIIQRLEKKLEALS